MPRPPAKPTDKPDGVVALELEGAVYHPDAVLGAAHVLARRLRVWLRPDGRGGTRARLANAEGGRLDAGAIEALFLDEAAAQELRRRVAAANGALREYVVMQALLAASGDGRAAAGGAALSPAEDAEVDRLIAEVEKEIEAKAAQFGAAAAEPTWEQEHGEGAEGAGPDRRP